MQNFILMSFTFNISADAIEPTKFTKAIEPIVKSTKAIKAIVEPTVTIELIVASTNATSEEEKAMSLD